MALRDGWLINEGEEGKRLVFKLVNGSPYEVQPDPNDPESESVLKLAPGYYDDDLKPVAEKDALAPDEDESEGEEDDEDEVSEEDLADLDEALAGDAKLAHEAVDYGPGHAPEFCHACRFYVKDGSHCEMVEDPIEADGWCKLWKVSGDE